MMLLSFAAREAIHIQAYSHLIDTLGMPETTYKQFMEYEAMAEKHDYLETLLGTDKSQLVQQIAAFSAFTEGVQLFSSFIMLLNFTRFNKMNGMGQIIAWSIKDESVHVEGMTWLFKEFLKEHRDIWTDELKAQLYSIAEKMVELEDKFIDLAFSTGGVEGLTIEEVKRYIRYIADRRLIGLGMKGIFKVKTNPLPWVEDILNAPEHANFFEQKATAYSKGSLTGSWGKVWK
jgi:ribonucleoside-diphosphate reductase beta chain